MCFAAFSRSILDTGETFEKLPLLEDRWCPRPGVVWTSSGELAPEELSLCCWLLLLDEEGPMTVDNGCAKRAAPTESLRPCEEELAPLAKAVCMLELLA